MTNINCASNCIYQQEGKCCLDNIATNTISSNHDCPYYYERAIYSQVISLDTAEVDKDNPMLNRS